jgi:hypothetical protein
MARALQRNAKSPLMLGTGAGLPARLDSRAI